MLSDNPAASSPQPEVCPDESIHRLPQPLLLHQQQQQAIPARALALRSSTGQLVIPENGSLYTSRQQLERRAVTPNSSLSRSSLQYPIQPSALTPLSEYHSGFTDEDLGSPCPFPTPFTGQTNHRRQQSFPNSLPLTLRSRTPSPTRKTHRRFPSEQMPFTGDGRRNIAARTESPRGGLSGWLGGTATAASALGISLNNTTETRSQSNGTNSGSSAFNASNSSSSTITSNIPTSLTTTTNDTNPTPNVTPSKVRATGTTTITNDPSTPKNNINSTMTSRFMSAISSRFNTPSAQSTPSRADVDDEIVNLNIEAALFPSGSAADRDSFSPAAFKNFQMNAVGLLTKIQSAYKDRVVALRDLEAERSAQQDELEEAETRAKHLKFQLEGMAAKAAEQERAMKQLMDELSAERKARQQLALMTSTVAASTSSSARAASVVSEDLGIDEIEARRKRKSADSRSFDDSEEDEIESAESESVFSISRCRSPTVTTTTTMTTTTTATSATTAQTQTQLPLIHYATNGSVPDSPPQVVGTPTTRGFGGSANVTPRQKTINGGAAQMSAFQKIFKGISGGNNEETNGCSNCKGKDASVAWDTVGLLRDENRHLKTRVTELEGAVEGALDVVRGIGL